MYERYRREVVAMFRKSGMRQKDLVSLLGYTTPGGRVYVSNVLAGRAKSQPLLDRMVDVFVAYESQKQSEAQAEAA